MTHAQHIIVAVDKPSRAEALPLVEALTPYGVLFKIGLELMSTSNNNADTVAKDIIARGGKVMLDPKLHDIPNTMAQAAKNFVAKGVWGITVHASSGTRGMSAVRKVCEQDQAIAVSVLTSHEEDECAHIYGKSTADKVLEFAYDAVEAQITRFVCSAKEIEHIRKRADLDVLQLVIPGIRPSWAITDDQSRIMTPRDALNAGANYLVIGRPITKPPHSIGGPSDALRAILDELRDR